MQVSGLGFLGGDVSKGICNFVLEGSSGNELESNFQLDDNRQGHRTLYQLLGAKKEEHKLKAIVVGLESTGGYENNWYKGLRAVSGKLGLEVYRINPRLIHHAAKSSTVRSVTDGVSASIIAGYMRKEYGSGVLTKKRLNQTNDKRAAERTLHKYIQHLSKQNGRSKNRLEKVLYSTMPELLSLKGEKYGNWFLNLLIKYPSKKLMLNSGLEGLKSIKGIRLTKVEAIYEALKESVGMDCNNLLSIAIQEEATDILNRTKKIKRLKATLVEELSKEEEVKEDIELLMSVKGVAQDSAVGFLLELGQLENYESGRKLVGYFGINPTLKQSGDKSYKPRMCKDGSANARAVIYMMAENVALHEPYFKMIYTKHRMGGKKHRSAIGAVMSKLTRVLFGLLKNRKQFESGVDQLNQLKKKHFKSTNSVKEEVQKSKGERRYQSAQGEVNAPISERQRRLRKQEQKAPN